MHGAETWQHKPWSHGFLIVCSYFNRQHHEKGDEEFLTFHPACVFECIYFAMALCMSQLTDYKFEIAQKKHKQKAKKSPSEPHEKLHKSETWTALRENTTRPLASVKGDTQRAIVVLQTVLVTSFHLYLDEIEQYCHFSSKRTHLTSCFHFRPLHKLFCRRFQALIVTSGSVRIMYKFIYTSSCLLTKILNWDDFCFCNFHRIENW